MPRATIITAAYNRASILRFAIESVRRQSFTDWEHIVVGDHCTDDTAAVVASFADPRIRFVNLERNTGGQSGPHNHALPLARGEVLFYLNQDDIYFPDHLASSIACLEATGADIVWSPFLIPSARHARGFADQDIVTGGDLPGGRFDPTQFLVASCWAMRTETARRIGRWKSGRETSVSPSQELIHRAWRQGCRLQQKPAASVLCIFSGQRRHAYLDDATAEHAHYFRRIHDEPDGRRVLFERAAETTAATRDAVAPASVRARSLLSRILAAVSRAAGRHPLALEYTLRYRAHGGFLAWHRQRVLGAAPSTPPQPPPQPPRPPQG